MSVLTVMRSRGTQVESGDLTSIDGSHMPFSGQKVFFRITFGDKVLQFKLFADSPFRVLFSKVDVVGNFVWHGVVLDPSETPLKYGMRPGEENTVTLSVVRDASKTATHADEMLMNDVARTHAYKRRLAEDKVNRVEAELDEAQRQIHALHAELRSLTDRHAAELQACAHSTAELSQRCDSLQEMVDHLQSQRARMVQLQGLSSPHHQSHTTASLARKSPTGKTSPAHGDIGARGGPIRANTARRVDEHSGDVQLRRLERELDSWQQSALFGRVGPKELTSARADRDSQPIALRVVFVDEAAQIERKLGDVVHPGPGPLLASQVLPLIRLPPDVDASLEVCTLCLLRADGSGHDVISFHEASSTLVRDGDTIYVARMAD